MSNLFPEYDNEDNTARVNKILSGFQQDTIDDGKNTGIAGDLVDVAQAGVIGGFADIARGATLGSENAVSKGLRDWSNSQYDTITPESIDAINNTGINDDLSIKDGSSLRGAALLATQGIGSIVPSFTPGLAIGSALNKIGKVGTLTGAVQRGVRSLNSAIGHGAGGALMIGGNTANQVQNEIMQAPLEQLANSEDFKNLYWKYRDSNKSEAESVNLARAEYADIKAQEGFNKGAPIGAVSMGLGNPVIEKLAKGGGASRLGSAIAGAVTEGGQEFGEGYGQQVAANEIAQDYDINRPTNKDAVSQGATGAVIGAGIGGAIGGIGYRPNAVDKQDKSKDDTTQQSNNDKFINRDGLVDTSLRDSIDKQFENRISANDLAIGLDERTAQLKRKRNEYSKQDDINRAYESLDLQKQQDINKAKYDGEFNSAQYLADIVRNKTPKMQQALDAKKGGEHIFNTQMADQLEAIRTETAQEKQGLSREALSNFNRGVDSSPANEIDNTNIMQGAINANSAVNNFKSSLNNPTEPNTSGLQDGINPQQVISELNDQKTKEQQIDEAFNSRQSSNKESDFAKFANEKGLNKSERKAVRKFMVKNKLNRSARKKFIDSLNNPTDNFGGVNDDTRSLLNKAITQAKEYSTSGEAENNQLALALQKALGKTNEKSTIKTTGSTTKDTNNEQKQGDRQLISNAGDNSLNGRVIDKKRSNDRPEPNGQDKPVITNDVALSDKQEEPPISQQKSGSDNSGSGKTPLDKTTTQLNNEQSKQAKDEKKNEEATAQRGSASGVNNGSSKLKGKKLPNLTTKESIEINSYKNINTGFVRARFGRDKITESQAQDIVDNHIYTPIEKEPIAQPKKNKEKAAINFNTNKSEGFKVGENAKAIDGKGAASGVVTAIRNTPNGTFISTSDTSLLDEEKQYHSINKFHNESEVKQDSKKAVKTAGQTNLELKIDKKTKKTSLNKSKEPVLDDVDSKHSQGNDEFNKYKDGVIKEFNGLRVAPVMYNPRRKLGKQTSSRLEASEVATKLRREGYTVSGMSPDIPSDAKILEVFNKTRNEESKTIPVPPNNKSDNATNGVVATKATDGGSVSGKEEVSPDASSDQKPTNNKATNPTDIKTSPIRDENTEKKSSKNIDDFGEKLGGAKKDIARRMTDEVKQMSDDEIASLPLSKIFPKKQIDNTEDKFSAAYLTVLREIIPSKPRKSYLVKSWVSKIKNVMGLVNMIETIPPTKILDKMRDSSALGLGDFANKIELLMNIDRESWTRIGGISDYSKAYSYDDNGNKVSSTAFYVEIDGKRNRVDGATKLEDTYSSVKQLLESAVESKRIPFEIRGRSGEYFINKKGDKEYRSLKSFTSLDDARKYKNENYDDLVKSWEATKDRDNVKRSDMRSKENRPRTGKDYRTGKDVSEDDFSKAFGFRGVEFGKWVKQGKSGKDRQGLLNQAYDALMDLSNILNIPSQAISLNGSLGLGLGSRGSGNASAHFEPSTIVINLTKTKGAGSLAHEWFHALDNYFSRMRDSEVNVNNGLNSQQHYRMNNYITYMPEPMYRHKTQPFGILTRSELAYRRKRNPNSVYKSEDWELDRSHPKGVRHEVESKFAELVEALEDSPMRLRAGRNDKSLTDGYWSRIIERGARSFENYVISKMQKSGYDNDFLANVVSIEKFARSPERYPYLLAEEMQPVESAFDNLFKTLKTKKTDEGTALYSKSTKTTGSTKADIIALLPRRIKKMLGNGLEVVQSVSDLPKSLQAKATDDIQGLYDPATDTIYLIADMLNKDNTLSVLSHEWLHKRLANDPKLKAQLDSTKAGLRDIFDKVQDGTYKGRYKKLYDEALDRVKSANTSTDDVMEEFIAYTVEIFNTKPQSLPAKLKQLIQKLIATIKMALRHAGLPVTRITPADLNSLAMQAVGKASVNPSTSNLVALASKQGYKGTDKIEANEWLEAIADGLDMSHDARMKRAKEMGFDVDTVWYHGSSLDGYVGTTDIKYFDKDMIGDKWNQDYKGFFFTDSKKSANYYANSDRDYKRPGSGNGVVYPVYLKKGKTHSVSPRNNLELKNEGAISYWDSNFEAYINLAEKENLDSISLNDGNETIIVVFEPNQIRSKFAAFDPKNKDSGNLLASYAGNKAKTADGVAQSVKFSKSYTDKVANAFSKEKLDEGIGKENTEEYGILNEKLGKIGELATKYLTTLDNLARNNPVARPFLDMVKLMQMKKDELLSKTNEAVVAYNNIGDTGISHFFTSMYDAEKSKSVQQKRLDRALFSGTINEEVFNDNKLKEQFKLNDKAIESYKKIRSYMDDMTKEYQDALLKRMGIKRDGEKLTLINQTGKAKDADILASGHNLIKEFKGLTGYFPLMRFGKHTITVKDEEGKIVYFSAEESAKKAIIAANKIKREFDKEIGQYKVSTGLLADTSRDDLAFDPRLLNMLGKYQEQIPGFSDVFDSVEQDILKNFSSSEFKKRFIHRKGTEGYSTDTSRTLASYGWSSSNYISKMLHVPEIQTYIDNDVNKHENPKTLEHLQKTLDYIKTPSNEYQAIKSFTFMYYMGANVKSAFVNLTQIPVTLGPFLANKFGDANTARSITESMKLAKKEQAILNKDSKGNVIKDVEYYLAWAEKEGLTFDSYLGDLIGAATGKRQAQARVANKALEKLTLMFSKAEMFNRRVSVASAYLLTKDMGLSDINNMLTESGHNAQINKEFAIKEFSKLTVTKTQFDYCVDTKTQCMTNKGWVNYYSLSIGDHIYAVDDDLKLVDSKVDNVNIFKGKKQIIEFSGGQGFSMAVTDNHDCLVQNYNSRDKKWQGVRKVKAGDLKNSQHILRVHKGYENNKEVFNDDEIKLFSWIAAEGWYAKFRNCKNKNNVRVAQSVSYNPKYVKDIEGILDRLGGHYSKHTYKRKQGDVIATFSLRKPLSSIVLKAMPDKLITNKLVNSMSARQMKIFIDVFVDADGNVVGKHRRISQKSKQNLDMLQMMCTITGTNASIVDYDAISELSIKCNSRTFVKQLKREIKTVNTVWCPETKEGTWIARRNGQVFLTGNSKFNRPAAFRGWGSVPLQFNQFMINYLQFIAGNGGGIGASVRSLGAVFLFAGLTGLPGADDLRAALEYAYTKITGKHIDINMESRKALVDMSKSFMGDEMAKNFAEAVLYGGSTLTPLDVSGSIGTGRVVPGLGDFFDTAKDKGELAGFSRFIMGASGATAGIARKTFRGIEEYNLSGDVTRALEKAPVIPIAIQNAFKAVRMATTGVDRNYAGKVSIEYHPTLIDTIAQALSFTPGERKRLYRQRNVNYRESEFLKMAHKKLLIRLSSAIADGDTERVREARQVIVEWNRDVPLKWRLSRDKVNRSIRRRMKNFNSASKNNNRALKHQFIENERYFTI